MNIDLTATQPKAHCTQVGREMPFQELNKKSNKYTEAQAETRVEEKEISLAYKQKPNRNDQNNKKLMTGSTSKNIKQIKNL